MERELPMAPDCHGQPDGKPWSEADKTRFPLPGTTIGLLALVVLLIWLVAGLLVLLVWTFGLIDWGERPTACG
jgi:hypothetical protein